MAAKTASLSVNIIANAARARAGLQEAESAFSKFRREVGAAQGGMAKFQTVSNAAFDSIKRNAAGFAAAAGTAIATFVVKSVTSFQNLALAAGKFSDATGLSTEQASRFIEVAGDIGIESSVLESAFNRMNRAIAAGAKEFGMINAEIVRTSSGAVDVQQTFFNVIDGLRGIEDPALRAQAATAILGRGWQSLARIVDEGSVVLARSLEKVDVSKLITDQEEAQAKKFQAALDDVKDSFESLGLTVGQNVVPPLTVLLNLLAKISDVSAPAAKTRSLERSIFETLVGFAEGIPLAEGFIARLVNLNNATSDLYEVTPALAEAWAGGYRAMIDAQYAADGLFTSMGDLTSQTDLAKAAWDTFTGSLSLDLAFLQMEQDIASFNEKWGAAMLEGSVDAKEFETDVLGQRLALARLAEQIVLTSNAATQNVIQFAVNTAPLERALFLLQSLQAGTIGIAGTGALTSFVSPYGAMPVGRILPGFELTASGGIFNGAQTRIIGEAGPEAVIPLTRPNRAMQLMEESGLADMAVGMSPMPVMSSGSTVININAGSVVTEGDLIESIRQGLVNAQRNGSRLVYSNT